MKIVQINAVYEYSSTGRTTKEMHERLLADGYDSYVFCADKHIPNKKVYRIGNSFDHKVHALLSRLSGRQGYYSLFATKNLVKRLESIKPDVVILRNLHSNFVHLSTLMKYLKQRDIAVICVLHDCWFFTGHCYYYTNAGCDRWKTGCGSCPIKGDACPSLFFDRSRACYKDKEKWFKGLDRLAVVGVSDWVTEEARESPIFPQNAIISRIYNWIDLRRFYPRDAHALRAWLNLTDEFVVLSVSQGWSVRKGLLKILDTAKTVPDVRFVLVGTFDYYGPIPANVITPGVTSNVEELADYYSMADALLVCSVQETFGKVSAEALACGTPVIANDATANPEIAGDECGISVHDNNINEIVQAIGRIRNITKQTYSQKCVERAQLEFDFEKQIQKYYELFRTLTNQNNA